MKPSVGRVVHFNETSWTGTETVSIVRAALVVECKLKPARAVGVGEDDFDVTLEVHATAMNVEHVRNPTIGPRLVPHLYIVESAKFSPARSGHESARGCWTWPPRVE